MGQSPSFDKLSDLHEMSLDKTGQRPNICNAKLSREHTETKGMNAACETRGNCEIYREGVAEGDGMVRNKAQIVVTKTPFYD